MQTAGHPKGSGSADGNAALKSHVATVGKGTPDMRTMTSFRDATDVEPKTDSSLTAGSPSSLGSTADAPAVGTSVVVLHAPSSPSLIPPASVIRARLDEIERERVRLRKLLKLAEEQEGAGE